MHLTVNQTDIARATPQLERATSPKSPSPALAAVLLQAADGTLTLSATDQEISVKMSIPAVITEPGKALLPARYFNALVQSAPTGTEITIRSGPDAQAAEITWGHSQYTLHGYNPSDFPDLPALTEDGSFSLTQSGLRHLIAHTSFAMAREENPPVLTGGYLHAAGTDIALAATDGYRVAFASLPAPGMPDIPPMIVPGRALAELARLLDDTDTPVTITARSNLLFVRGDGFEFSTRLIEGSFPNYRQVLPKEIVSRVVVNKDDLLLACNRANALQAQEQVPIIRFAAEPDGLLAQFSTSEDHRGSEKIAASLEGNSMQLAFNARYLADALRQIDTSEAELEFSGPITACRIRGHNQENFYVVMLPLRIQSG